jgi:transcriptional regulator with XRE-family HTH domain
MVEHPTASDQESGPPDPGEALKRARHQRGWSLGDVAQASGLSSSFLSSVERGESDIAYRRLVRLAAVFGHDVGSFLGFSARPAQPYFLNDDERITVDRGDGINYQVFRLPGTGLEAILVELQPHSRFSSELKHEGMDITVVTKGAVTATYNQADYVLNAGECVMWSAGYPHSFANHTDDPAQYLGIVTAMVF